jgi:hypothetical protein
MKMFDHSLIALAIQAIFAIFFKDLWLGAVAGSFYFIGREYAQAEHRNIQNNYHGLRSNMPFWGGLQPRAWTLKGLVDFILPTVVVVIVALLY